MVMKIVFLCSANTSRSPMAEGIFKKMVRDIDVSSAGFLLESGERADEYAILVCSKHGIDLKDFKTTNICDVDFENADLVLTATISNRDKIRKVYPNINAYTIKECSGGYCDLDIEDPSDGGLGDYVVCFFEIKEALEKILEIHKEWGN